MIISKIKPSCLPAQGPVVSGPGGEVPPAAGRDLPAPAAGVPQQRPEEGGRPVQLLLQPQQPQLGLGPALQLLHALLPVHAQPQRLEPEQGQ